MVTTRPVGQEREVPLPQKILAMLRDFWRTHRSPQWLFPARLRHCNHTEPVPPKNLESAFARAVELSGVKKAAHVHTLRQNAVSREMPSCTGNPALLLVNWPFWRPSTRHFRGPGERPSACRQGGNGPAAV